MSRKLAQAGMRQEITLEQDFILIGSDMLSFFFADKKNLEIIQGMYSK
jgi:hypothetical protein